MTLLIISVCAGLAASPAADRINIDLAPMYEPFAQRLHALYDTYTDTELTLICEFLRRAAVSQRIATEALTRSEVDQ